MADLKPAMAVSLVDRLTAPAKKAAAAVKSVSGEVGNVSRTAKRATDPLRSVSDKLSAASRASKRAGDRMTGLRGAMRPSVGATKGMTRALKFAGAGLGIVTTLGSSAAYYLKRTFVDTATQFERFETVLKTIEGSSEKARQSMQWVADFAAQTPYELAAANEAFVKLRAYGLDPTTGLMHTLGDTASAMGKPIMQAVEAIADAVTAKTSG